MRRILLLGLVVAALTGCAGQPAGVPPTALRGPTVPTRAPTTLPTPDITATPTLVPLPPPSDTPSSAAKLAPAQTAEPAPALHVEGWLLAGRVVTGTLDDAHSAALYTLLGQAGDTVNLSLKARSGDLDTYLFVLDPEGREVARDDDAGDGTHDSAIRGLHLSASGVYTVVATRFLHSLGATRGDFVLRYDAADADAPPFGAFSRPVAYDSLQDGAISDAAPEQVFTFSGNAGDLVTIQVSAASGDLQPVITLTDAQGRLIEQGAASDDQGRPAAVIRRVQLPQTGSYSIAVAAPQGQAQTGDFSLKLALDQAGVAGVDRPIYAVLHPLRSFSVVGSAATAPGYVAGVRLDGEGRQIGSQAVLTYVLPELDAGTLKQARLEWGGCIEQGGGFSVIGPLDVYDDPTGAASANPDAFRPSVGARKVAAMSACDPVDVTDSIQRAYTAGASAAQFWIVAPKAPVDSQAHSVEFTTPRLAIDVG